MKITTHEKNIQILYEDNHIIAVNKRVGDIVQGDKTGDTTLAEVIKLYLKEKYNKKGNVYLGITHRLDRPTTGIIIFAKTSKALTRLNTLFQKKEIQKTYWAMVKNTPPKKSERLIHWLIRNHKQNKSYAHLKKVANSKEAILKYTILKKLTNYYLLEINLETGRHHQIRAQLSAIGCPIKGDLKYGFSRSNENGGIHLHARKLTFIHPIKKIPITIQAPLPKDTLWNIGSTS